MLTELLQEGGLSLDRLQSFCRVAEAGGVTKAAGGDPGRQSLFSRQIKELEEFFGAELIRRKGRGIVLTEAGARLDTIARACFAALSDLQGACKGQRVEIVIGAGESIIQWLLLPRLEGIAEQLPNARMKLINLPTAEATRRLADGLIDFALVRKNAVNRPLQPKSLGRLGYALFVPTRLQAGRGRKDGLELLARLPLATIEGEGTFRRELARLADQGCLKLNLQLECTSFPQAARAVATGNYAAVLPAIASADLSPAVATQVALPFTKGLDRELCLATNPRLLRIRPILEKAGAVLAKTCQLDA